MATFPDSGNINDTRSGGKIVNKRRRRPTTPYDRPQEQPQLRSKSPNLFTDVIFPATRRIASGAAKILSFVFDSDTSDCSSSASSSDSEAAEHADNDYDELDDFSDTQKDHGAPSDTMEYVNEVRQLSDQKSEKTREIENLLRKENYSREECDKLTQIINSRVVDSTVGGAQAGLTTDNDIFSKAITEARKWLKEKVALSPLSDGADVSCGLESVAIQQIDNEAASPVDIAKTYMRSRPPWASPFAGNIELDTSSTIKSQLSGKRTLFSADDLYPSSKQKQTSLASGSWNIQEEIRRVRQKATEDLLQSPSRRFYLPSLELSPRCGQDSSIDNLLTIGKGHIGDYSTSLTKSKPINFSLNDTALGCSNDGVSAKEIGNGLANDGEMSRAALSSEEYLDPQAIVTAAGYAASTPTHPANLSMKQNDGSSGPPSNGDLQPACVNGSLVEELTNINEMNSNCHAPSQTSDLVEESIVDIHTQNTDVNPSPVEDIEMEPTGDIDEKCEPSKASIEVPVMQETDCITNFCQTDLPWMLTQSDKSMFAGNPDPIAVKQEGRKMGRYSRRGKGRGK